MTYLRELVGSLPCVGIVAHIDPRTYPVPDMPEGSVRASQLPVVLDRLDRIVALAQNIKLWDGKGLKVEKACTPVGGPLEAAIVQRQFEQAGVDCIIHSMCTWSMGWETQFFGHPEWLELYEAMNGTAWPGAVLLNSLRASATAHLRPVWCSYPPDVEGLSGSKELHPVTTKNITDFLHCAAARTMMRGKSYASIGHVSMGIAGSEALSDIYAHYFGMKLCHVEQEEIHQRILKQMFDLGEHGRACAWFFNTFAGQIDPDQKRSRDKLEALVHDWLVPITLVVRDIMRGNDAIKDQERSQGLNAILGGTAGQRYWTDWFPNFDFTEAILCSMFDWFGHRLPIILATENDGLNGLAMLWATLLTGISALFADLRTYWSRKAIRELTGVETQDYNIAPRGGLLHLINSGPAALEWGTDPGEPNPEIRTQKAIQGVTWHPAELGYFPHDGLSTHFCTPGNLPVTMIRFNRVGTNLTVTVVEGHTIGLWAKVAHAVRHVTNPTWPDTFVVPDGEVTALEYMEKHNDPNHVACAAGHIGREVLLLASMLRIPVAFTNVSNRWLPTLWEHLGGDFRACEKLGPLYS